MSKIWLLLWQPLVTRPIVTQTINLLIEYLYRDHKRTRQGVSAVIINKILTGCDTGAE